MACWIVHITPDRSVSRHESAGCVVVRNHAEINRWRLKQALAERLRRLSCWQIASLQKEGVSASGSVPEGTRLRRKGVVSMNLIQQLEQEEIARLGKTIPISPG